MLRTTSASGAALTFTPRAMPLSSPAYAASAPTSRAASSGAEGTANTRLPNRAAARARSASEKLDAMTPILGEVAKRTTGTAHAPGRHPTRASSVAAPPAMMPP